MRLATISDLDNIVEMGLKFAQESSDYSTIADKESIRNLVYQTLISPQTERIVLFKEGKGMLGGAVSPSMYSKDMIATEIFWWVEPSERKSGLGSQLLSAFEYWAKNVALCTIIAVSSLDDSIGEFYQKKGYKPVERTYMKVIK